MSIIRRFDESLGGITDPLNVTGGDNTTASGDVNALLTGDLFGRDGSGGEGDVAFETPSVGESIPWTQIGLFLLALVAINAFAGGFGEGLTG